MGEIRNNLGNVRLSDWFNRPVLLEQGDNFDSLTRGMASQAELKSDQFHDSEVLFSSQKVTNYILMYIIISDNTIPL